MLKRTYADLSPFGGDTEGAHDTYYVYDDYGNLTYVIPPKVTTNSVSATELNELCYQYKYDHRNRLVEKKLPGKGWEDIVYNKLDQPILTRDPNLKANGQWLFTKYDAFGRVAYTGLVTSTSSRSAHQTAANGTTDQYESPSATTATKFESNTVSVYYGNNAYPKTGISKIHTVNYYDGYADANGLSVPTTVLGQATATNVTGLATVSKVRVLDPSATAGQADWITTLTGYDAKGRPIYTASKNTYLGTTDVVETQLDFVGRAEQVRASHTRGTNAALVTTDNFTYDHMGRLVKQEQTIGPHTETIVENSYDDLGRLVQKKVGGGSTGSPTALQEVEYGYNVRGWLKSINNGTATGGDLWGMEIAYNDPTNFGGNENPMALFNGNISQVQWKTASPNNTGNPVSERYSFGYDALNRLTSARDNTIRYNMTALYDKNGNITELNRNGPTNPAATTFGAMDRLGYSYDAGNKLTKVLDIGNKTYGFKDGNTDGHDYWYDANGNMVRDLNKGIGTTSMDGIGYNHMNLPTEIKFDNSSTKKITYIYDALGTELKKMTYDNGVLTTTDYAGNYIYENNALEFFSYPEGYVNVENNGYRYVYQYKDHLGNVRLSYTDNPSNPGTPTIIEENNYYPFGLEQKGYNGQINGVENNHFNYNGKELEKDLDLGWMDYGARRYMRDLGRWGSLDPLAEKYTNLSPFTYVANNPINAIDPDGRLIIFIGGLRIEAGIQDQIPGSRNSSAYYGIFSGTVNNPITQYWRTNRNTFGQSADIANLFTNYYGDNNTYFTSGSSHYQSSAGQRIREGAAKARQFHKMVQNGDITLEDGETIKVVSHSQGGAHSIGFMDQLMTYTDEDGNSLYNIEVVWHITPHQPTQNGMTNPNGVEGFQISHPSDAISSNAPWWLPNGGSEFGQINGIPDGNFFGDDIMGGEGQPPAEGPHKNRGGHNVTDNYNAILWLMVNDFCRKNPDKCTISE